MKKLILIAASLMVAVTTYGQGQFSFSNRDTAAGVNARFVLPGEAGTGTLSSVGTDYTITLLGGAKGATTLVPLETSSTPVFRGAAGTSLAGYISPVVVTVPGVPGGAEADVLVRVSGPGGTFEQKYTTLVQTAPATPPALAMGNQLLVVPEPSTLALGALGLGALLAIRRRK